MQKFYQKRLERLSQGIEPDGALLVLEEKDVSYLTGFSGDSSSLFVIRDKAYFITDGRYTEQIKAEKMVELEIIEVSPERRLVAVITELVTTHRIKTLSIDKSQILYGLYEKIADKMKPLSVEILDADVLSNMRIVKDEWEIEIIRENLILTELAYLHCIPLVEEGLTEIEIAAELEYFLRKRLATKMSFDTIIASGNRSALPHGSASDKKIEKNTLVLFDFGILKNGYCSDFTRCYFYGKPIPPKIAEIHQVVLEALLEAESIIRPDMMAKEVHQRAFDTIKKAGYAEFFTHSTGHGVGRDIHESPTISATGETLLKEGMVFTVEPGIYLPDIGGIRLEDMVVVRKNGIERLTQTSYEL